MSFSYSHLTIPSEKSTSINLVAPLRVVRERILIVDDSITVQRLFFNDDIPKEYFAWKNQTKQKSIDKFAKNDVVDNNFLR